MTRSNLSSRYSGLHIRLWLLLGVPLTLIVLSPSLVATHALTASDASIWSITGNLNVAREHHAVTLLPNGKVLIIGGFGPGPSNSAEIYEPLTGTWTNSGSSNLLHFYPTATLLPNGKVLVVSDTGVGIPGAGGAELFDPATGTWSLTGRLNNQEYRTFHTATLLPNGKVLVAGGANGDFLFVATASAELYDPATGTWTTTGNLNQPRALHTATLLPNGQVLVVGGIDWDEGGPIYNTAELYDPATGIWSNTGSLGTARCDHTATLLDNGKVLVAGGLFLIRDYFVTNGAELYDPATGNWSTTASLSTPRHGQTATRLPNGEILVVGGSSTNNASNTSLNTAELYDPSTESWALTSSLNNARQWHTASLLTNGGVLIAGGINISAGGFTVLNSTEVYGLTSANSIDNAQFFVRQHYLDFLNREPDQGGFAYWTDQITQCGSDARCIHERRIGVSAAFFVEPEFQDTGYFVYRFYKASFGRQPNYTEFTSDRSRIVVDANLEANKQVFAEQWVQREAFFQAYPLTMSNSEVINKLFDSAGLTSSAYDSLRQQEIQAMNAGRSRAFVLRDVIEIPDFRNIPDPNDPRYSELKQISQYNPAFVLMQYFGYLRRDVDQGGYDFWLDVLNNREPNNYRAMVCAFLTSAEYQLRFGTGVTRNNRDCGEQ